MAETVARLQKQLGYVFKNPALLQQSLTHCSAGEIHNKRLEFFGDAVLNFVITKAIYTRFPDATEGDLTQMRSTLVCGKTLAELGNTFFVDGDLILGKGVAKGGNVRRDTLVADALEALIGAIYLDNPQSDVIEKLIIDWYKSRLDTIQPGNKQKDPKTRLQEHLQGIYQTRPVYAILVPKSNDHEQKFMVQCKIAPIQAEFIGEGTSKRRAEQAAAKQAIEYLIQHQVRKIKNMDVLPDSSAT